MCKKKWKRKKTQQISEEDSKNNSLCYPSHSTPQTSFLRGNHPFYYLLRYEHTSVNKCKHTRATYPRSLTQGKKYLSLYSTVQYNPLHHCSHQKIIKYIHCCDGLSEHVTHILTVLKQLRVVDMRYI